MPVTIPLGNHRSSDFAGCGRIESDVEETGARDVDRGDPVNFRQSVSQFCCKIARVDADFLRQLHRNRCCPIAVITIFRALKRNHRIIDVEGTIATP